MCASCDSYDHSRNCGVHCWDHSYEVDHALTGSFWEEGGGSVEEQQIWRCQPCGCVRVGPAEVRPSRKRSARPWWKDHACHGPMTAAQDGRLIWWTANRYEDGKIVQVELVFFCWRCLRDWRRRGASDH